MFKIARQIHIETGNETKYRLIGIKKSYHGLTLGSLAAMGRTKLMVLPKKVDYLSHSNHF